MEIELKLALPASDPSQLARRLARIPLLARRKSACEQLHNTYFDTRDWTLHEQRIALRIRRKGSGAARQWAQTLKIGGQGDSALSQRGEWEAPVPGAALVLDVLAATPWSDIDPHGTVFRALTPCFVTEFERTSWLVRRRDGSAVEVALDIGQVKAGNRSAPICELELELLAGKPQALFDVAHEIARAIALLPLHTGKSDRGYALAQDTLTAPRCAQPPALTSGLTLAQAASRLLREMFTQFTCNLNAMRCSDDPELVHQARVGWRRFRSAWRLFRPVLASDAVPSWQPLQPLMTCIGELRDIDVARTETLPALGHAYGAADSARAQDWKALELVFQNAAMLQRKTVRYALENPAVGATLLATTQWLEALSESDTEVPIDAPGTTKNGLRPWARRSVDQLYKKLERARKTSSNPQDQHRVRIFAKRLRYAIDALGALLPRKRTLSRYKHAVGLQARIGVARDYLQASAIAQKLEADRALVQFLRGYAAGREWRM